jgi:hypothetical protein
MEPVVKTMEELAKSSLDNYVPRQRFVSVMGLVVGNRPWQF